MSVVFGELSLAGNADISSAVIDCRRGGTHTAQFQLLQIGDLALCGNLCRVETASLRGKIITVGGLIIRNITADVRVQSALFVQHSSGLRVEAEQIGGLFGVSAVAVIGADQHEVFADISACPIKSALRSVRPFGFFRFVGLFRIFILDAEADKIGIACFGVPKAGIKIAVIIGDRAVRLSAQLVRIDPQGFERLGVKGLHDAACQTDKDLAVRVGRRYNAEAGIVDHRRGSDAFATDRIHLVDGLALIVV